MIAGDVGDYGKFKRQELIELLRWELLVRGINSCGLGVGGVGGWWWGGGAGRRKTEFDITGVKRRIARYGGALLYRKIELGRLKEDDPFVDIEVVSEYMTTRPVAAMGSYKYLIPESEPLLLGDMSYWGDEVEIGVDDDRTGMAKSQRNGEEMYWAPSITSEWER